jgi:hypothetical protein
MATIKYNTDEEGNKKIILKDGKVSCECCGCESVKKILDTGLFSGWDQLVAFGYNGNAPAVFDFDIFGLNLRITLISEILKLVSENPYPGGASRRTGGRRLCDMCLRFLCRKVIVKNGAIISETNTEFGGPTSTGKDFWEDICKPEFGDETQSGTYMYIISFKGWRNFYDNVGPNGGRTVNVGDQDYKIWKYKVTKIQ